jgi:hypothetical protein
MSEKYYVVCFPDRMSIRYIDEDETGYWRLSRIAIDLPHEEDSRLRAERVAKLLNRLAEEHATDLRRARLWNF